MNRTGETSDNLLRLDDTLLTAVERMDGVRRKLLVVVDNERGLLGTLTDGDIRRGLMRRLSMDTPVRNMMNLNPVSLTVGESEAEAVRRLSERGVVLAPMLERTGPGRWALSRRDGRLGQTRTLVVMMAGGRGMRLAPLTQNCPKPMLKVAGQPLLETIIERLREQGFWRFRLAANYQAWASRFAICASIIRAAPQVPWRCWTSLSRGRS